MKHETFNAKKLPQTKWEAKAFAKLHGLAHPIMRCVTQPCSLKQVKVTCSKFLSFEDWNRLLSQATDIHECIALAKEFGEAKNFADKALVASWAANEAGNASLQNALEVRGQEAWDKTRKMLQDARS